MWCKSHFSRASQNLSAPITSEFVNIVPIFWIFLLILVEFQPKCPTIIKKPHPDLTKPLEAVLKFISKPEVENNFSCIFCCMYLKILYYRAKWRPFECSKYPTTELTSMTFIYKWQQNFANFFLQQKKYFSEVILRLLKTSVTSERRGHL